jgi:hypothetical protein
VRNINLAPPVPDATGRPSTRRAPYGPQFGVVQVTELDAQSNYHGMTASIAARRQSFTVDAYYTSATAAAPTTPSAASAAWCSTTRTILANEYNWSNIDQRPPVRRHAMVSRALRAGSRRPRCGESGRPYSATVGSDLNRDGVPARSAGDRRRRDPANTTATRAIRKSTCGRSARSRWPAVARDPRSSCSTCSTRRTSRSARPTWSTARDGPAERRPVAQAPPRTFGQIKDANGNYLLNSTLRTAPSRPLGLRIQF